MIESEQNKRGKRLEADRRALSDPTGSLAAGGSIQSRIASPKSNPLVAQSQWSEYSSGASRGNWRG